MHQKFKENKTPTVLAQSAQIYKSSEDCLEDLDQIEKSFQAITTIKSPWRQRLILIKAAKYFGLSASEFQRIFELWQQEITEAGGGNAA